jgi:hypothetical protein
MRAAVSNAIWGIALSLAIAIPAHSQNQQNSKNAPPPRAVARPVVRPQMVRPMQQMQGQRPGQMMQGQRVGGGGGGQVRLVRPGVVRGPAGALRTVMPSNIVHNPRHVAGRAGSRYNRQAFMFRRGNHFYRRAYYLGPDGAVYFYDEPIPDDDPSLAASAPNSLPTCPIDADDCQGFSDPVAAKQMPVAGADFLGDWGTPDCDPMSSHRLFFLNEAGQFVTLNTDRGEEGNPSIAQQVKQTDPDTLVVTYQDVGKLLLITYVKAEGGMVIMDTRYSTGEVSIENGHSVAPARLFFIRTSTDQDLHFVRCSP